MKADRLGVLVAGLALLVAVAGCGEDAGSGDPGGTPATDGGVGCDPPCASNEECLLGLSCQTRSCGEDSECGPDFLCDQRRRMCDLARCDAGGGCGAGETCDVGSGRCVPAGCRSDDDCGADQRCDADTGECEPVGSCQDDDDCEGTARCDGDSGECLGGACEGDEQCFADEHCHSSGDCVPGCHNDEGCGGGRTCDLEQHECVGGACEADLECPAGLYCALPDGGEPGTCRSGCRVGDCPAPAECDPSLRECVGGPCAADDECPVSQYCSAESCALGCRGDAYCEGGRLCDLDTRTCHSPPCTEHAHCRVGEYCDPQALRCLPGCADELDCRPGQTCSAEHECLGASCADHLDCPDGFYCDEILTRCAPGCREHGECVGGICDALAHSCRPCGHDEECGAGSYCDARLGDCFPGCRLEPGGCPEGDHCDEELRTCVPDQLGCDGDAQCPQDAYCDAELASCRPGCRLDGANCEPLEACDPVTRGCVPLECGGDGDCPAGHYCGADRGCLPGCRVGGGDCPADQPCDPDTHGCGCSADEQCPEGTLCTMARCVEGCRQDTDCPDEQLCAAGRCAAGCRDDEHEDNDTALTATPLQGTTELEGQVVCPGDEDWFTLAVAAGDTVDVSLGFEQVAGNLDMELYCDDELLAAARSEDDGERLRVDQAPVCRALLLRVLGRNGAANPGYSLRVDLRPYECPADAAEPNERVASAAPLGPGAHVGLTLCQGDEDWYRLRLFPGTRLVATLAGPQRLELYAHDGLSVLALGRRGANETVIDHTCVADGYYHLRVWDPPAGEAAQYTLDVELPPPLPECPDDESEPNDEPVGALSLDDLRDAELYACVGNPDWFSVELARRSRLSVALRAGPASVLRARLWGPGEAEPRAERGCAPGELVELAADVSSGRYLVHVEAVEGGSGAYELWATAEELVCMPDHLEPNETLEEAAPLEQSTTGLTICPGDEDWYAVEVAEHEDLEVAIAFVHRDGDLDLDLHGPDGRLLDRSETEDDGELLRRHNLAAGTYWVRVYGFWAQTETLYDLALRVHDPRDECPPDLYEPNEDAGTATDLVDDLVAGVLCSPDEDWYRVLPAAGRPLRVRVEFFHFLGDLDLDVLGPDGVTLLGRSDSTSSRNYEEVLLPAPAAEPHFLRVYGLGGARNEYDLLVER